MGNLQAWRTWRHNVRMEAGTLQSAITAERKSQHVRRCPWCSSRTGGEPRMDIGQSGLSEQGDPGYLKSLHKWKGRAVPVLRLSVRVRSLRLTSARCGLPFCSGWHRRNTRSLARSLRCPLGLGRRLRRNQTKSLAHFGFKLGHDVFVVLQELAGILASLADTLALIAEPGPGFFQDI